MDPLDCRQLGPRYVPVVGENQRLAARGLPQPGEPGADWQPDFIDRPEVNESKIIAGSPADSRSANPRLRRLVAVRTTQQVEVRKQGSKPACLRRRRDDARGGVLPEEGLSGPGSSPKPPPHSSPVARICRHNPGISDIDRVRHSRGDEADRRQVDRGEGPADQERASSGRLPATQPSAGRELELVEQQRLQRPACEMPVGGVLERLVKTVCSGSGAGHTLDAVAEVVLEGQRDPGGALSARRIRCCPRQTRRRLPWGRLRSSDYSGADPGRPETQLG